MAILLKFRRFKSFGRLFLTAGIVALFFAQNVALAGLGEANIWADRRRPSVAAQKDSNPSSRFASIPINVPSFPPLGAPLGDKTLLDLGIDLGLGTGRKLNLQVVPDWVRLAVAPYATIHEIHLEKKSASPTVLLIQDAHLHTEAQMNIAGALTALVKNYPNHQQMPVGMEGARSGAIDFSAFRQYPERDMLRRTAEGMLRANIVNGIEYAAIAESDGLLKVVGIENQAEYDAHVRALLASLPAQKKVLGELRIWKGRLDDLKKTHLSTALTVFDAKRSGLEEGTVGLPEYALYLDSVVTATTPNIRELIEAALLEGAIHFDAVETQRKEFLSELIPKTSKAQVNRLVQLSALFRAKQISYTAYYEVLKRFADSCGISFSRYPEMNLYVQYVLKSESIDHESLFEELKELEGQAEESLVASSEQKEVLALSKDFFLVKKLVDHILTENEWRIYDARRAEIGRLNARLAKLGAAPAADLHRLAARLPLFENFYELALARNRTMSNNFTQAARNFDTSVLVAGGFHTQGLVSYLKHNGFNVLVLSPKIQTIQEGLSSVEVLASGRLPLDRLFSGEKLFLPTPPVSAAQPQTFTDLMIGAAEAGRQLASGMLSVTVRWGKLRITASKRKGREGFEVQDPNGPYHVMAAFSGQPFPWLDKALEAAGVDDNARERLLNGLGLVLEEDPAQENPQFEPNGKSDFVSEQQDRRRDWVDQAADRYKLLSPHIRYVALNHPPLQELLTAVKGIAEALIVSHPRAMNLVFRHVLKIKPHQGTMEKTLSAGFEQVQQELGITNALVKVMVSGSGEGIDDDLIEMRRVGRERGRQKRELYELEISEKYIQSKVLNDERVQAVILGAGLEGARAKSEAKKWLLRQFAAHELIEGVLRKRGADLTEDTDIQREVHQHLQRKWMGIKLPSWLDITKQKQFYARTLGDWVADIISDKPDLFNDPSAPRSPPKNEPGALAFFGNDPARILIEAALQILEIPCSQAVTFMIGAVNECIQGSESAFTDQQRRFLQKTFEDLRSLNRDAGDLVRQAVEAVLPAFAAVKPFADLVIQHALLGPEAPYFGLEHGSLRMMGNIGLADILRNHFELRNATVGFELLPVSERLQEADIAFVQVFENVGGKKQYVIRATWPSVVKILDSAVSIQSRAAQAGVSLSERAAQELSFQIFLLHEIGEGILGISDEELVKAGLADEQRLLAAGTQQPFFTIEGLVGQLQLVQYRSVGPDLIKSVFDRIVHHNVMPKEIRAQELEAVAALGQARPILRDLFAPRRAQNYRLGVSHDLVRDVEFDAKGDISLRGLDSLRTSEIDLSRAIALGAVKGGAAAFEPAEQVYQRLEMGEPQTLSIFDQKGGLKDLIDQHVRFTDPVSGQLSRGQPHVVGIMQTEDEFWTLLTDYIKFIKSTMGEESDEYKRAIEFRNDLSNPAVFHPIWLDPARAKVLKPDPKTGVWNISELADYFKTEANKVLGPNQIQKMVFVSDWRQLVVDQATIAVTVLMNLNVFITLEGRMKAETWAAIQA